MVYCGEFRGASLVHFPRRMSRRSFPGRTCFFPPKKPKMSAGRWWPVYQPGHALMNFVGQNPPGTGTVPMMQMMQPSQQSMEIPMMAPYYAPNQQPGYFWQVGVGNNKLNISVNSTCHPTPTHNYALQPLSSSRPLWPMPPLSNDGPSLILGQ